MTRNVPPDADFNSHALDLLVKPKPHDPRSLPERLVTRLLERLASWSEDSLIRLLSCSMIPALVVLMFLSPIPWIWRWGLLVLTFIGQLVGFFAMGASVVQMKREFLLRQNRSLEAIRALKWRDLEAFTAAILQLEGYEVELRGGNQADGGIDLVAHRAGKKTYVQCKHYQIDKVGPEPVRALYGIMARDGADESIFVTSGDFADVVFEEFEHVPRISLVNGAAMVARLEALGDKLPEGEEKEGGSPLHLAVRIIEAISADPNPATITPPICPKCKFQMVLRFSERNAEKFWACRNYGKSCPGKTLPLKAYETEILDPDRRKSVRDVAS